ncbi:hypothetical protein CDAR_69891 [Caerostris darwini]|uniref:Uncharacterized protein n=1 Tax=Caerostris darwini TaxID=1538125 RepID=A0AAV4SZ93_9ARAC|nr:hypothetical protein CDAR_69891 [Caerostris darwini]
MINCPFFHSLEVVWNSEKESHVIGAGGGRPWSVAINRIILRDFANSYGTINMTLTLCPVNKREAVPSEFIRAMHHQGPIADPLWSDPK